MPSTQAPLRPSPSPRLVLRRACLAAVIAAALVAVAAIVMLEVKSVEYGLPVSELIEAGTARLWVYETITSDGLLAPPPPIVKVRWVPSLDDVVRAGLEGRFALEPIELQPPHTWVYRLRNLSHANVRALLADALVDDVDGLDRRGFATPAEPLGHALGRAHRFGLVHLVTRAFDEPRRAQLIALVRKTADPVLRWSFFAIVAIGAASGMALRARWPFRTSHHGPRSVVRDPLSDCAVRDPAEIGGTRALDDLQVGARRVLRDLFLSDPQGRSPARALSYTAAIAAVLLLFQRGLIFAPPAATNTPFAARAVDAAIGRAFCGATSAVHELSPGLAVLRDSSLHDVPIRQLILDRLGSLDEYCSALSPYRLAENSPVLVMSAVLLWMPGASARTLAHGVNAVKLLIVLALCFLWASLGISVAAACAAAIVAIGVVAAVGHTYVQYSYLGLQLALGAAACAFVLCRLAGARPPVAAALGVPLGVAGAFGINLRTSHVPIYAALLTLLVALAAFRRPPARASRVAIAAVALGFFCGYLSFAITFLHPIDRATALARSDYTFHAIAHPLVLSLALSSRESLDRPESVAGNELSRREGILFDDDEGLKLARRMDPQVEYLGAGYEPAMWAYYFRLWHESPREMLGIYWRKFQLANAEIRGRLHAGAQPPRAAGIPIVLDGRVWPRSVAVFWLFLLLLAAAAAGYVRSGGGASAVLAFASLAACLVYLEMTVVVPQFQLQYFNFVPMYIGLAGILLAQVAVDTLARVRAWRTA